MRKLRPDGSQAFAWDGAVLACDDEGIVLRAEFSVPVVELGFTTFRGGDVFHEFYYWDRWYNVFQVSEPDGTLKGWYANVGAPADGSPERGELSYVDLELDVWSHPDGEFVVLDEDEYEALASNPACTAQLISGAAEGRAALLALAVARRLPRWPADASGGG